MIDGLRRRVSNPFSQEAQPAMAKKKPEPPWLRRLRRRKEPLRLAISEDGEIVAWKFSFDGDHDYNLVIWHPEGDLDFGYDEPSRGERLGVDAAAFRRLPYTKQKGRVLQAIVDSGVEHLLENGLPWRDGQRGMLRWLSAAPVIPDEFSPSISPCINEYLFGHAIHDGFTTKERKALGIQQRDIGGMGSDEVMAVVVSGSMADLNTALKKKGLPMRIVEDRRSGADPERLVRFDFPPNAVAGLDFKAMADAFQEFAKKAMRNRKDA
jgi:hypothetical protein